MVDSNDNSRNVTFILGGMIFEYDDEKNKVNIEKHGISFRTAARVFFDFDRIEYFDDKNSSEEDRYDTIGDLSAGLIELSKGKENNSIKHANSLDNDVVYVVYTERVVQTRNGREVDVTRIISARLASSFERGIYYGGHS